MTIKVVEHYHTVRMVSSYQLHQPEFDNFILVYTMGKVGSTAIARSLETAGIFCRHLQWLTPTTQIFMDKLGRLKPNRLFDALNRLNRLRSYNALVNPKYAEVVKVVTSVRAPIEQILSHCFQAHEVYEFHLREKNVSANAGNLMDMILAAVDYFLEHPNRTIYDLTDELSTESLPVIYFCWSVHNYLNWFDHELLPFFPTPIIGGQMLDGYQLAGNILIVKFEELALNGEKAIAAYAQRPQFRLQRENAGEEKSYGEIYREVLGTIKFPRAFVDYLCDSKYVCHFYSEDERRDQKKRWVG